MYPWSTLHGYPHIYGSPAQPVILSKLSGILNGRKMNVLSSHTILIAPGIAKSPIFGVLWGKINIIALQKAKKSIKFNKSEGFSNE